jgi:carbon monoxide dehydrogenase subunit G
VQIENTFTVALPVDDLWMFMLDVERIAPCMPGARLTEAVDERTWKGKVAVKLGPVSLSFAGVVTIEERDDAAHRVVLSAKGMEEKGKGAANAKVTSWLEPDGSNTTVRMMSDVTLSGSVAQLSRGLLPEVSKKLTKEFADCLEQTISEVPSDRAIHVGIEPSRDAASRTELPRTESRPVSGIRLGLAALWSTIVGFFRRLLSGRSKP